MRVLFSYLYEVQAPQGAKNVSAVQEGVLK